MMEGLQWSRLILFVVFGGSSVVFVFLYLCDGCSFELFKCLWSKTIFSWYHLVGDMLLVKQYNCCLFERLFKVKKNCDFLFGISIFVLEIFMFLYYANEQSNDVIGGSVETAQHSIENNSRNIIEVFFKLGTSNVHHKRNIMTLSIVTLPWQQLCRWFCFNCD